MEENKGERLKIAIMEKDNSKIITVSFVAASFLAAVTTSILLETAAASFGFVAQLYAQDGIRHGVPVTVALVTFAVLQFNKKTVIWADEVVLEIRKVVWPSRRDTTAMTVVVCIMLAISCAILFVFDYISTEVVRIMVQ